METKNTENLFNYMACWFQEEDFGQDGEVEDDEDDDDDDDDDEGELYWNEPFSDFMTSFGSVGVQVSKIVFSRSEEEQGGKGEKRKREAEDEDDDDEEEDD